jgi:hypothetical protein
VKQRKKMIEQAEWFVASLSVMATSIFVLKEQTEEV